MSGHDEAILAYAVTASGFDILQRRIPNWITGPYAVSFIVLWFFADAPWSWGGVLCAFVLGWVADLPHGDTKALMVLGGALSIPPLVVVSIFAFVAAGFMFILYRMGRLPYPGRWALFPLFAVPACVIVLGRPW